MVARKDHDNSKSLFKLKRGLSKFYANKSQSFSTLDHAMMTCLGHSALALEKPRQRSVEPAPRSDVDMEVSAVSGLLAQKLWSGLIRAEMLLCFKSVTSCQHALPS